MPKIRGIKPELWTDENFVELSPYARLLWIGLWNHACDNGHVQDKSKQIKMRVLPTDEVNAAELLREIESEGLIESLAGQLAEDSGATPEQEAARLAVNLCAKAMQGPMNLKGETPYEIAMRALAKARGETA